MVGLWKLPLGLSLPDDLNDDLGPFSIGLPMQLMRQPLQQSLPALVHLRVTRLGCRLQVSLLCEQIEWVLDDHVQPIEHLTVSNHCGHHRLQVVLHR